MKIDNKFNIEQMVFLKTDEDQRERIVTSFKVFKNEIRYYLAYSTVETLHYEFEISDTKDYKK